MCDALLPHSRPRPILPVAKRVRFGDDIPPHAPLASPVWDPGSSVRMPQNALPSVPSTPTPFRCTTTGMSIVPLKPLAQRLEAWLTLPSLSRWLTCTIRLGYAIQFARRPPKFNGVLETSVAVRNAPVLREEIAVLLAKEAFPDLVSRTHFPHDSTSLAHSSEEGTPLSGTRHHMAPASRSMEPPCVAPGQDAADLSGLPPAVVETIIQARAPSTRQTYILKRSQFVLFAIWCSSPREDPRRCTIGVVLSFLQERLERRLSPSTLKVYVAAIAAHHDAVDGRSLGKHDLIVRFLKGARRMNPYRSPLVPSLDLSIVLAGLQSRWT